MVNMKKGKKTIVFLLDSFILATVNTIVFYILPDCGRIGNHDFILLLLPHLILLMLCMGVSQFILKNYKTLWRYAESREYLRFLIGGILGYIVFVILDYLILIRHVEWPISLGGYSLSLLVMILMRLIYRQYSNHRKIKDTGNRIRLAIIGAGEAGTKLLEEIEKNPNSKYQVICFIDDDVNKIGKWIRGVEIKGPISNLQKILQLSPVKEIIVAIPSMTAEKEKEILEICSQVKCRVRVLPNTLELQQHYDEKELWKSVRDIKIDELLGREQITFDNKEVISFIADKVVLVTGGGGSIGSELCRQIAKFKPRRLIILDNYENNAYDIQQELLMLYGTRLDLKVEIASIRNEDKVNQVFERYRPDIIFHAAAHKHVPLMEACPEEAIMNNILGTYHVVQAADKYGAEKFVLISTDKAVNPTSIMGASKRFCEMIIQSMKGVSRTEYAAVRFGNVLGSNGSVIPLFQKQIAMGGPVTITDKRITRYFMTISEAVQLVLQAGAMAVSGEIYVLDMGEPIKIIDLAENLIRLSGHIPYTEIPIIETGLRPGEKLYEERLTDNEELIATQNHKIYIERPENISRKTIKKGIKLLKRSLKSRSLAKIKKTMKQVVPTYKDPEEVNTLVLPFEQEQTYSSKQEQENQQTDVEPDHSESEHKGEVT